MPLWSPSGAAFAGLERVMKRVCATAAFGWVMLLTGMPLNAAATENVRAVNVVDMRNINTSSEPGADRLLRRIRDSAQSECAVQFGPRSQDAASRDGTCMHASMARMVAAVRSSLVTARFDRVGEAMILAITSPN